jgi:MmyB-like transcription regulator ligand binding domain
MHSGVGPAGSVISQQEVSSFADTKIRWNEYGTRKSAEYAHPRAKTVLVEWSVVTGATVHGLRLNFGHFPADPAIAELVAEVTERSTEFRALWADHTVGALTRAFKVFVHSEVGRIELTYQTFDVHDTPGQQLLIGIPEPGSRSEEALPYLASIAAPA